MQRMGLPCPLFDNKLSARYQTFFHLCRWHARHLSSSPSPKLDCWSASRHDFGIYFLFEIIESASNLLIIACQPQPCALQELSLITDDRVVLANLASHLAECLKLV